MRTLAHVAVLAAVFCGCHAAARPGDLASLPVRDPVGNIVGRFNSVVLPVVLL